MRMKYLIMVLITIISFIFVSTGISQAITISANPNPATVGQNVTINVQTCTSYGCEVGTLSSVNINFGDGSPAVTIPVTRQSTVKSYNHDTCWGDLSNNNITHTYNNPGKYTITAKSEPGGTCRPYPPDPATTVIIVSCTPLMITSASELPGYNYALLAEQNKAGKLVPYTYSYQIQTSGGRAPLNFSLISGSMPPGLKLSSSGKISGTPTTAGIYNFKIKASDSCDVGGVQSVEKPFSITIMKPETSPMIRPREALPQPEPIQKPSFPPRPRF